MRKHKAGKPTSADSVVNRANMGQIEDAIEMMADEFIAASTITAPSVVIAFAMGLRVSGVPEETIRQMAEDFESGYRRSLEDGTARQSFVEAARASAGAAPPSNLN